MNHRAGVVAVVASLLLAACGGGESADEVASLEQADAAPAETTEGTETESMEDGLIAFTECLREQGLEVGDPVVGPDGGLQMPPIEMEAMVEGDGPPDQAEMDAAMRQMDSVFAECEPLLGRVQFVNDDLPEFDEFEDLLLAYAGCMRDNGFDMPDPDLSDGGGVINLGMAGPDDPAFAAADEACREILAGFGPMG